MSDFRASVIPVGSCRSARNVRAGKRSGRRFYGPRTRMQSLFYAPVPPVPPPSVDYVVSRPFDETNARLMPKPLQIVGRRDTYLGPHLVPKPQQGERAVKQRRYWKMKGIGLSFGEGAAILYRLGADRVYRNYDTHALEAFFPSFASVPVLDKRMGDAGWQPYVRSFSNPKHYPKNL